MQGHGEPDHVAGAVVDPWGVCPGCGGCVWSTLPTDVSVVEPQNHPAIVHWLHSVWASKLGGMHGSRENHRRHGASLRRVCQGEATSWSVCGCQIKIPRVGPFSHTKWIV